MPQGTIIDTKNAASMAQYIDLLTANKDPLRHENYKKTVEHAEDMSVHINGEMPKKLLETYRPNEPKDIHDYRLSIFQPITKSKAKKVLNVLARINNAKNYSIVFPKDVSGLIKNEGFDESLEEYTTKEYPYFGNIIQWVFDIVLKQACADPNAIICFKPIKYNESRYSEEEKPEDVKFLEPFGYTYSSKFVLDYNTDEYYTVKLTEKSLVQVGDKKELSGQMFNIYTRNEIVEIKQIGNKHDNKYQWSVVFVHNLGECPVITLGGEYVDNTFPFMYESFIAGILPYWNDAVREFSDKQAVFVQHVYLERVEIQVECDNTACGTGTNGKGDVIEKGFICDTKGNTQKCQRCGGSGFITGRSPYGITTVKKDALDGENPIFPGVQYIDKPVEIVNLLKTDIDEMIKQGFEAINMDIVFNVGENQSGVAKAYDRSDLDGFLGMISNNLFDNILHYCFKYINKLRYSGVSGMGKKEVDAQMPVINKPTSFDVLSIAQMISDFSSKANIPSELKDSIMLDIFGKMFANDEFKLNYNKAIINLDPFRGKTEEEKFLMFSNGAISEVDYKVSSNLKLLVAKAYGDDNEFFAQTEAEQYEELKTLAKSLGTAI